VGSKLGHRLRPTVERERLYRFVLQLRKEGLSYNQIISKIEAEHGVALRKSHISGWINGKHKPFGSVRTFDAKPCPELAYVIGVTKGDASMSVSRNYNYKIKLRVTDKEFAEEFARCLSVVLGRNPPRVKWHQKTCSWHTEISSLLLQNVLKQPLPNLKRFIEGNDACAAAFLRGFFDSEGWVYLTQLGVVNTNTVTLRYVSKLLEWRFGMRVRGPRVSSRGGRIVIIKGKPYHANRDCYSLLVDKSSLSVYQNIVGFTIQRKQQRLALAIARLA
jgi:DNA endonuclease